jgi:hypothetical protein
MVGLASLWLPILLASVLVFVVSAAVWMALPHHKTDWSRLPDQEGFMDALGAQNAAPGMYGVPHHLDVDWKDPEQVAKVAEGPTAFVYVTDPKRMTTMSAQLIQIFIFYLVVNFFIAYLATATLPMGTDYLKVFQVTGAAAFMAHGAAHFMYGIWFGASWSFVWKNVADSLLYALLTAGVFGWMWP